MILKKEIIEKMRSIDIINGSQEEKNNHFILTKKLFVINELTHLSEEKLKKIIDKITLKTDIFQILKQNKI